MLFIIPDLLKQINKFTVLPKWELLKFIDVNKTELKYIFKNPKSLDLIKKCIKINREFVEYINKNNINNLMVRTYLINLDWESIVSNINALKIIIKYYDANKLSYTEKKYIYSMITTNKLHKKFTKWINNNPIDPVLFDKYKSLNISYKKFIKYSPFISNWYELSKNANAIKILEFEYYNSIVNKRICKINFGELSSNINAGKLLLIEYKRSLLNKIYMLDKYNIYRNPGAFDVITLMESERHSDTYYFDAISGNPNPKIFDLVKNSLIKQEIIQHDVLYNMKQTKKYYNDPNIYINHKILATNPDIFVVDKNLYKNLCKKIFVSLY